MITKVIQRIEALRKEKLIRSPYLGYIKARETSIMDYIQAYDKKRL